MPYEVAQADANPNLAGTQIDFDLPGVGPQTIVLSQALTLSNTAGPIKIAAPASGVTIDGNDRSDIFTIEQGVSATLDFLTITDGSSAFGGAIYNDGDLVLSSCTIKESRGSSRGGGLYNAGTATITDSTIANNLAYGGGGGLYNAGTATITDSTIAGNYGYTGGIENAGTLTVVSATIADNAGTDNGGFGGLTNDPGGSTLLCDTIVAGNTASNSASDIKGTVASSSSYNLIGTGGAGGLTNGTDHNQIGVNPLLSPLGNYSGPTPTMAVLPGSPAIAAGSSSIAGVTVPTIDQRGVARPSDSVRRGRLPGPGVHHHPLRHRRGTGRRVQCDGRGHQPLRRSGRRRGRHLQPFAAVVRGPHDRRSLHRHERGCLDHCCLRIGAGRGLLRSVRVGDGRGPIVAPALQYRAVGSVIRTSPRSPGRPGPGGSPGDGPAAGRRERAGDASMTSPDSDPARSFMARRARRGSISPS